MTDAGGVAVTGLGSVSVAGLGTVALWDWLQRPDVAGDIHRVTEQLAALHVEPARAFRRLDRFAQFALIAADEALADAGLAPDEVGGPTSGVVLGNAVGGLGSFEAQAAVQAARGPGAVMPLTATRVMPNAAAAALSLRYGCQGPSLTVNTSCASGSDAVAWGATLIRSGVCDRVLVGGAEAPMADTLIASFRALGAMTSGSCEPFAATRSGFALGEGAGVLLLERATLAARRGAAVYCYVAGAGSTSDAHHVSAPRPDGEIAAMAMDQALARALAATGVTSTDIAYVSAHGTGTMYNDSTESLALARVFGTGAVPPVTANKGALGHTLGAAGALEAVVASLSLRHRLVPRTANTQEAASDCPVDLVTTPRPLAGEAVLSNSFGFGGHNASLVFSAVR